jgi:RNA polymerase primary sigma factor
VGKSPWEFIVNSDTKKKASGDSDDISEAYFNQIKRISLLNFDEVLDLSRRIQQGDKAALNRLVEANLRLVVKIARGYTANDVPLMDLIQEGNIGLIRAAEKYDYRKNIHFSTYAAWWIRQSISRYLSNKRRTIRLPHRKEEILRKVQRSYHMLSQTLMRQPKMDEISKAIGIPRKDVDLVVRMTNGLMSLDLETGDEEATSVMDMHEDYTYSPEADLMRKSSRDETIRFLDHLKDKEKRILIYRYQLNDGERYTLKKISDKMGISPETVRQIEIRALRKMRLHATELRNNFFAI